MSRSMIYCFFDEKNTEQIINDDQANLIKSYAWSKKYGLVQYTFQDGTVFTRKTTKQ